MKLPSFPSLRIYERKRTGKLLFFSISIAAIVFFLIMSNNLVKELAAQEKERMDIWAQATERLAKAEADADFEFLIEIIAQNNSIPVLVTDADYNIIEYRNFRLPEKIAATSPIGASLSDRNREFLQNRLRHSSGSRPLNEVAADNPHFIELEVYEGVHQYIYYEDSILLRRLSLYPYVQLAVMLVIALILYSAVVYTKKAEQNKVWVGLSKETAHQLGTPISSLMAWSQYLEAAGIDPEITREIDKDVNRLSTIADRFSKIGSRPELQLEYLNDIVTESLNYMKSRISGNVKLVMNLPANDTGVYVSRSLFEWVMENLTKNAVDAMDGRGTIEISTGIDKENAWIEVKDTGRGIARKNFKNVFNPGFTTKKRGWGLGLTLVKRIIEEYHDGKIIVKESEPGKGTTFRIELPCVGN